MIGLNGHRLRKVDFPECPAAELSRFLARKSVSGDVSKATKLVAAYLEWRTLERCSGAWRGFLDTERGGVDSVVWTGH